jgi:hypothetical protein
MKDNPSELLMGNRKQTFLPRFDSQNFKTKFLRNTQIDFVGLSKIYLPDCCGFPAVER